MNTLCKALDMRVRTSSVGEVVGDRLEKGLLTHYCTQNPLSRRIEFAAALPLSIIDNVIACFFYTFKDIGNQISAPCDVHYGTYHYSASLLAVPFYCLIGIIKPEAKCLGAKNYSGGPKYGFLAAYPERVVSLAERYRGISQGLSEAALSPKRNILERHVVARAFYLMAILCFIITRIADAVIGTLAGVAALATLGKYDLLNEIAFQALQAPALITDLSFCVTRIIFNPYLSPPKAKVRYKLPINSG
jgi:hypothetical protein